MKQVKEKYVSFEVAKLAKEKGCDLLCNNYYTPTGVLEFLNEGELASNQFIDKLFEDKGFVVAPSQYLLLCWIEANSDMVLTVVPFGFSKIGACSNMITDGTWSWWIHNKSGVWVDDECDYLNRQESTGDLLLNALKRM